MQNTKVSGLFIITLIALIAALLVWLIYSTEPTAEREAATKKTDMLVDVIQVKRGSYKPRIVGLGSVEAAQDIALRPRVNGHIIEISDNFMPGGFVKAGETLLKIDPADYQYRLAQMQSALAKAQSELAIEQGRQNVAEKEYALLQETLGEENKALVLRKPQLSVAKANVKSAKAMLNQAKLDLKRSTIKAPFDAQILARNVNIGSEVDSNTELARLVGVDEYWIIASVPVAKLRHINFPEAGKAGAKVLIRNRSAWGEGITREGRVVRLIGALDGQTRLARILVSVKDPLALKSETQGPAMLVGAIVQTEITGQALHDVFRIKRDFLREGDRLWLKRDGKLSITQAKLVLKDKRYAYLSEGMESGDLLVTNNLTAVAEGIGLRTEVEDPPTAMSEEEKLEQEKPEAETRK